MRRRVSIVLCTIGDPKILIFDEPTTGLDPENRRLVWKFINSLKTRERSILLTTHLLEEAEILSDRIGILSRGQLVEVGTAAELKRN
jgi:ABC-2 type transport system ATP-binding protein